MPYRDISSNAVDIRKAQGQPFEGVFKGGREILTKIGNQMIWEFTGLDGIGFSIYGFTNLNRAMESIEPGTRLKVVYLGTRLVETKYGLKDVHQVSLSIWEEGEPTL